MAVKQSFDRTAAGGGAVFRQIPLSEFFPGIITGFGYAIGIEHQDVPGSRLHSPIEQSHSLNSPEVCWLTQVAPGGHRLAAAGQTSARKFA